MTYYVKRLKKKNPQLFRFRFIKISNYLSLVIWTSADVVDLHFAPLMQVLSTLLVSKTRTSHVCLAATFSCSLRVASQVGTSFSQNHSEQGEHPANCLLIENHHSHNENSSFFSLNKSFCGLISSFLLIGGTIFCTECQHLKHIENFHSFWQMLHCRHTTAPTHVCFGALSIDWTNFTAINCKSRKIFPEYWLKSLY